MRDRKQEEKMTETMQTNPCFKCIKLTGGGGGGLRQSYGKKSNEITIIINSYEEGP